MKIALSIIRTTSLLYALVYLIIWIGEGKWNWFLNIGQWVWYGKLALFYVLFLGLCGAFAIEQERQAYITHKKMMEDYERRLNRHQHGKGTDTL